MGSNNIKLSVWAQNITPSPTMAVDARAKALKADGKDICGFGAGEPDFDTPSFIKDACLKALQDGHTKYLPPPGLPKLREALAGKYRTVNGIEGLKTENIVISPGGKYSCHLAINTVCGPGDEVLIAAPYWVSYPEMVKLVGAKPAIISANDSSGFKVSPQQLEAAITDRTRLFILNSPSNPTGAVYNREELEAIMEIIIRRNIYLMSDEIYEYMLYDGVTHHSPASFSKEAADHTITVGGFSKTFSMTGWRLGTLVARAEIAKAVSSIQSHTTSNATTFAQFGALAAMENEELAAREVNKMLVAFDRRRLFMLERLGKIPGITCQRAQGAFYLFPNISSCNLKSSDFSARLLEDELVAVVPGIAFGDDDYIRLSYATSDNIIEKGLDRLDKFCRQLAN